jgi:hypothetical protein
MNGKLALIHGDINMNLKSEFGKKKKEASSDEAEGIVKKVIKEQKLSPYSRPTM